MPDAYDNADFDALVRVIEKLQGRIERDRETIGSNEIRTRTALIDPLLNALGWDTANPSMVIPEYPAGDGVADYALLKVAQSGWPQPIAFIEAKRLSEDLRPHRAQALAYANIATVKYAGLTNGDRWELYEVFREVPLHERRIVDVSLSRESPIDCAIKLQVLRWPSLESGGMVPSDAAQVLLFRALRSNAAVSSIELLLDRGVRLGPDRPNGWTPLHEAAQNARPEVIEILLDHGASVAAKDSDGSTPLHNAAGLNADSAVAEMLLDRGADIAATDHVGMTPLHLAARNNAPAVIETLLDRGADNMARDKFGRTPLHLAARFNEDLQVIDLLIERSANIRARDCDGDTPIHHAAGNKSNPEIIALLLNRGADIEMRGHYDRTPLHHAVLYNPSPEITATLLDRGAYITARDKFGWTPLIVAAGNTRNGEKVVELLLDRGAQISAKDSSGGTALHRAARVGAPGVVKLLLDRGAIIEAMDNDGCTPLHIGASIHSNTQAIALLLDEGANIEARNHSHRTPLHIAASLDESLDYPEYENTKALLDSGADIEAQDSDGRTPIHCAAASSTEAVVRLLLIQGADVMARDNVGGTPLHRGRDGHIAEALLAYGASIRERNDRGETPLHCAAQDGRPEVVECLVESGAEVEARVSDMFGWTALHMAAGNGYRYSAIQSIEMLLIGGANPSTLTHDNQTAYQIAEQRGASEEILQLLRGRD